MPRVRQAVVCSDDCDDGDGDMPTNLLDARLSPTDNAGGD